MSTPRASLWPRRCARRRPVTSSNTCPALPCPALPCPALPCPAPVPLASPFCGARIVSSCACVVGRRTASDHLPGQHGARLRHPLLPPGTAPAPHASLPRAAPSHVTLTRHPPTSPSHVTLTRHPHSAIPYHILLSAPTPPPPLPLPHLTPPLLHPLFLPPVLHAAAPQHHHLRRPADGAAGLAVRGRRGRRRAVGERRHDVPAHHHPGAPKIPRARALLAPIFTPAPLHPRYTTSRHVTHDTYSRLFFSPTTTINKPDHHDHVFDGAWGPAARHGQQRALHPHPHHQRAHERHERDDRMLGYVATPLLCSPSRHSVLPFIERMIRSQLLFSSFLSLLPLHPTGPAVASFTGTSHLHVAPHYCFAPLLAPSFTLRGRARAV